MCIYSPMPHTLSYCALIGKCALIRSNTVYQNYVGHLCLCLKNFRGQLELTKGRTLVLLRNKESLRSQVFIWAFLAVYLHIQNTVSSVLKP